jgi:5-methylcytosine-specific restriction enzyme A
MSPRAPTKPCLVWRCPKFALPRKARCEQHQREYYQQANATREPGLVEFYNSTAWKKLRSAYRRENPFCEICANEGRETLAQQVDHRVPLREAPDRALEWSNLRSLCMSCHSRRTRMDEQHPPGTPGGGL